MKTLKENIEDKLEELLTQISANNITKETISKLEVLVRDILENTENLDKLEIEEYIDRIYKDNNEVKKEEIKANLVTLKKLAMAKRKTGESIFDFDKDQEEYIKNFCIDAIAFIKKAKEKLYNNTNLDNYKKLLNKMQNREKLSSNDLPLIIEMFKDKSKVELQANLMDFYRYNLEIEKLNNIQDTKEQANLESEEQIEELMSDEETIKENIEKIVKSLRLNETHNEKSIKKVVSDHSAEIGSTIKFGNATEVLKTLEDLYIYQKFGTEELFILMLYGTKKSIQETYEEFNNRDNIMYGNEVIFKFPSLWVEQTELKRTDRKKANYGKHDGAKTTITLKTKSKHMTKKELYDKIQFYKENGFDIEELLKNQKQCQKGFTPSLSTLKSKYDDFRLYDVKPKPSLFAKIGNVKKACDEMIECNLLMPFGENNNHRSRSLNLYPSFISHKAGHVLIAESLLGTEEEDIIMSERKQTNINIEFTTLMKIKNVKPNLEEYQRIHEMEITNKHNLNRYREMEEASINSDFTSSLTNNETEFIKELDERYKENNYRYKINNSIISRMKVIRLYDALQEYNKMLSDENKLDENDIKFFAITYGTYIKKDTYEQIKKEVYERRSRLR